jgi:hypothetical protein
MTPADFAQALLSRLALPVSDNNIAALVAFQAHEGGFMHNSASFNPLNTTQPAPGGRQASGLDQHIGVKAYANWNEGLEATARTLQNGLYGGILAALKRSAHPDETLKQIGASKWGCTICGKTPAANLLSYAHLEFPAGGGMLDTFTSPFHHMTPKKFAVIAVGGVALVGVALIAWGSHKRRTEGG